MTDLTKGIIEINGFEIGPNATSDDIKTKLDGIYVNRAVSKSGNVEVFSFKNIYLINRKFDIDVTFIDEKISTIELFSYHAEHLSYDERHKDDCYWLESILGTPSLIADSGHFYYFEGMRIYSFIQRDLSRNPAETFICCKYGG